MAETRSFEEEYSPPPHQPNLPKPPAAGAPAMPLGGPDEIGRAHV